MRRANQVQIMRPGNDPVNVDVENGVTTLEEALEDAGISLTSTESVSVNGEKIEKDELDSVRLDDTDTVQIFGKKEGGLK